MSIHLNEMPSIFTTPIQEKLGHLVKYKKNQESVKCYFSLMNLYSTEKKSKEKNV